MGIGGVENPGTHRGCYVMDNKSIVYGKVARRWRIKLEEQHPNGSNAVWFYGCYFPQTDLWVGEMGARGTGLPKDVEWLDEPKEDI